ncbi:MAG: polyprenyl synthetase family protein [Candidatus Liberibacter ctenarytainae]|uniref:Probable farnesyl diphosphate synthase n=1 Tax=Candidatus Liberibacter ctenarytainae TaxID=2020335 RepID=A0A937AF40_9HYPH|nr:polyprenyl synthetase family protein [Candidatus Liberibacter ctenarytainae]
MEDTIKIKLQEHSRRIEVLLDNLLSHESSRPKQLLSAMRYAILNGGKKLRSFLVVECSSLFGCYHPIALRIGAAIECVHCYSLIHDDLPAMDNGRIRRGKPTVHLQYDESTAILAGNSLLTYAFEIIFSPEFQLDNKIRSELALSLARNSGLIGMLGGQMLDIQDEPLDENNPFIVQQMKTGALMGFSCAAGAIISQEDQEHRERLDCFGQNLGIIFQLVDDLLDLEDPHKTDKHSINNSTTKKNSFITLKGREWVQQEIDKRIEKTLKLLDNYRTKARSLRDIVHLFSS